MVFYIAHFETENFEFFAYAETPRLARELIQMKWAKHAKETGASLMWEQIAPWVDVTPTEMNSAHRRG